MRTKSLRKHIISFLIMLSVLVTVSTFAYWTSNVEGSTRDSISTIHVGTASEAKTTLTISPDQSDTLGVLVPQGQLENSIDPFSVDEITLFHNLLWDESQEQTQTDGNVIEGYISMEYSIDIYPDNQEDSLDKEEYSNVYGLLHVEVDSSNSKTIILNDVDTEEMIYSISMEEPNNKTEYDIISQSTIVFTFIYNINLETEHLSIDFTDITMEEFMAYSPISNDIDKWDTTLNEPLTHGTYGGESLLLIPIEQDEYTIIVNAQLTNPDSTSGGYGILFDTIAEEDASNDSGYIFQFDRGYSRGSMVTRERVFGSERNPNWSYIADNELFPDKYQDPDWWTDLHEIKIEVSNLDETTRTATFYIDGELYGSITYEDTITDEQVYVGFRGWSNSSTEYYSIEVK